MDVSAVKEILEREGKDQKDFAIEIGIAYGTLNKILNGHQTLTYDHVLRIWNGLKAMGVAVEMELPLGDQAPTQSQVRDLVRALVVWGIEMSRSEEDKGDFIADAAELIAEQLTEVLYADPGAFSTDRIAGVLEPAKNNVLFLEEISKRRSPPKDEAG